MVFSSLEFIFFFLPFVLLLNWLLPSRYRNYFLLAVSILFYIIGEKNRFVFVLLGSIVFNYLIGVGIHNCQHWRKKVLTLGIVGDILLLGYFKYSHFFMEQFGVEMKSIHLPIGISFFTFQSISYLVDVYRKPSLYQNNPFKLGLYISLFPQLIAGPIVRYSDIALEIERRTIRSDLFKSGVLRFVTGLVKKVLIANSMGMIADSAFYMPAHEIPMSMAWLGVLCYSLQIYFDFSGYSDMAIGLGRMFGFQFSENFKHPYISKSIAEFWRRWHISLSSWFRDYLYIPMGGNREGNYRTYFNLLVVFLLTGFWHGSSWNFVIWGLWHGLFLLVEKATRDRLKSFRVLRIFRHIYVLLVVIIGWVFFRANDLSEAVTYIERMFFFSEEKDNYYALLYFTEKSIAIMLIGVFLAIPTKAYLIRLLNRFFSNDSLILEFLSVLFVIISLFVCVLELINNSFNPFIYFRF